MTRALVFDSGVGGLSVLDALAAAQLDLEIDYAADNAWLPYGEKSDAELKVRCPALIAALARQLSPDVVVLACNTASTIALAEVRAAVAQPVVGVVPPIKPAAELSRSRVIGLLATPGTVRRAYTDELIRNFAADAHVIRCGASALVRVAEDALAGNEPDEKVIREAIAPLFSAPRGDEIDVVALACTHFPLIAEALARTAPRPVRWLDSGAAIARRVKQVSGCAAGAARMRHAALSEASGWAKLGAAFAARGFSSYRAIEPAPLFTLHAHAA